MSQAYRKKRDFSRTPEPRGGQRKPGRKPLFVIQKHDASSLHYDFRIEVDGVLKSWAVPKGPSADPRERRLAIPTEDHPLDYADFEGGYVLQRTSAGKDAKWLLIKADDEGADARRKPVSTQPKSVLSGRTMPQVKKDAS